MNTINEYISLINDGISRIKYPATPERLYAPIEYTMLHGGKRLRPVLTLMCCEAFDVDCKDVMPQAIGIELFHNFTLLHDDVMDNADVRRGMPTVHCKWDDNTAILSGDAMLTMATQFIADASPEKIKAVIDLFNTTAMEIYEGQQYDIDFEKRLDVSVDEYLMMIRLKTSVLIGCACKLGAIVGGASIADCNALYSFGENLGIAFQLQDDYLDVYGDSASFGKEIGGDILNNKKTFLLASAMKLAQGDDRKELFEWINLNDTSRNVEKIKSVTEIYNRLDIPQLCKLSIEDYINKTTAVLDSVNIANDARAVFVDFLNMLMNRNK